MRFFKDFLGVINFEGELNRTFFGKIIFYFDSLSFPIFEILFFDYPYLVHFESYMYFKFNCIDYIFLLF